VTYLKTVIFLLTCIPFIELCDVQMEMKSEIALNGINQLRCNVYQNIVTRKFFANFEIHGISIPWVRCEIFLAVDYG
jgi:hypothetical protein